MSSKVENSTLVCIRISSAGSMMNTEFHRLSAKFGKDIFSVWIKPSKPFPPNAAALKTGLQSRGSYMLFRGQRVDSVSMKMALSMFLGALETLSKPALLVTHSERNRFVLLLQEIEKWGMTDMFKNVLAGCADSYPIFKQRDQNLKERNQLALHNLLPYLSHTEYVEDESDETYYLEVMEDLVSRYIGMPLLIKYSNAGPFSNIFPRLTSFEIYNGLKPLHLILSANTLENIAKAGISYEMLEKASETRSIAKILHLFKIRTNNKQRINNEFETAYEILHFFENQDPSRKSKRLQGAPGDFSRAKRQDNSTILTEKESKRLLDAITVEENAQSESESDLSKEEQTEIENEIIDVMSKDGTQNEQDGSLAQQPGDPFDAFGNEGQEEKKDEPDFNVIERMQLEEELDNLMGIKRARNEQGNSLIELEENPSTAASTDFSRQMQTEAYPVAKKRKQNENEIDVSMAGGVAPFRQRNSLIMRQGEPSTAFSTDLHGKMQTELDSTEKEQRQISHALTAEKNLSDNTDNPLSIQEQLLFDEIAELMAGPSLTVFTWPELT
ncbi:uncharacterized protein [Venturia canescens]|uniref:uncharacterized protein isoform X2 n=1 Tax=Venturia canescens TaxID=32260 RepID=UPI001C9C6F20|nr:uncharacterized protein LOC122407881 isoform X2 [Venturia canescens]